jgi:peptidoglycan hydrolase-like protein with peptidoglycan-binding domain
MSIGAASVTLDPSMVPELNRPAKITLNGLTFNKPLILKNGVECTTCGTSSYANGIISFTVTSFSTYSVIETPPVVTTSGVGTNKNSDYNKPPKDVIVTGAGGVGTAGAPNTVPCTATGSAAASPFTRTLQLGSTGADVRSLQQFLNSKGYRVAATGPGSPGFESTYFGPATKAAVVRFQTANSITPTSGAVGPLTRAKINQLRGVTTACAPVTSTIGGVIFTRTLQLGSVGTDVKALQQYLNRKGFNVSTVGAGSLGYETSYFGPKMKAALIKFQKANNITPASGIFGPITRGRVNGVR